MTMNRRHNVRSAPAPFAAWEELWSRFDSRDSRTVRKRSWAGLVPSAIAVLSMSVVTVFTIVLVVTAVADAGSLIHAHDDTWSRWATSPDIRFGDSDAAPASYAAIAEEWMNNESAIDPIDPD